MATIFRYYSFTRLKAALFLQRFWNLFQLLRNGPWVALFRRAAIRQLFTTKFNLCYLVALDE